MRSTRFFSRARTRSQRGYVLISAIALAIPLLSLSAQQKHSLTYQDFAAVRAVADPQISPDARLVAATDALVRVTRACICGSDLWPYQQMPPTETGRRMGHEFIGIVEDVGRDVRTIRRGDFVVAPFAIARRTLLKARLP